MDLQKRFFGNFDTLARVGSATAPVTNRVAQSSLGRWALERLVGIDRRRDLPEFQRETFHDWFQQRPTQAGGGRRAVVYPDTYTNHVQVERGKAAVEFLQTLGVEVVVPDPCDSGRAALSQGMISTARNRAETLAAELEGYVASGYDVVVIEPSDLAMLRREYERLLDQPTYEIIRDNSYELMEYIYGLLENGYELPEGTTGTHCTLTYHGHCQQRTLGLEEYTTAVLDRLGYDVESTRVECCGMAGSFGYKTQYYDLAMAVGETLHDHIGDPGDCVVASGTSCMEQLESVLKRPVTHPIEVVWNDLLSPGSYEPDS